MPIQSPHCIVWKKIHIWFKSEWRVLIWWCLYHPRCPVTIYTDTEPGLQCKHSSVKVATNIWGHFHNIWRRPLLPLPVSFHNYESIKDTTLSLCLKLGGFSINVKDQWWAVLFCESNETAWILLWKLPWNFVDTFTAQLSQTRTN